MARFKKYSWLLLCLLGLILVNVVASHYFTRLDLTEEKRYTLGPATRDMLSRVDGTLLVQVLLEGTFPADFKRLRQATEEALQDFSSVNSYIQYTFRDPLLGDREEVLERMEAWSKVGIIPTELNINDVEGQSRKQIFPFAIFNFGDRQIAINLLEGNTEGMSPEVAINNSISLLEYKFANAISKLMASHKPNVVFTQGHGELSAGQTASLSNNLSAFYNVGSLFLDSLVRIPDEVALVLIAKPTQPFSEKDLFKIDQYVMHGGRVIFLLDPLIVNVDSLAARSPYVPYNNETNLDELLFKYGCRVVPNLVLDLESSMIPMASGQGTNSGQPKLFQWYYHPLAAGYGDHPIVKGLDRVDLQFPSSIDTVKTRTAIRKIPLLTSSNYSRLQYSPVMLDFNILRVPPDQVDFDAGPQVLAMLLEGSFTSLYRNRVSNQMLQGLQEIGMDYREMGEPTKIIVVSDGDIARNHTNPRTGQIRPLGYNQYINYTFDNMDFLSNAIEYLLDRQGLIETRAKNVKLRLLDKPRIAEESVKWQLINVLAPLLLLIFFGGIFTYFRKRKYGQV